MDIGKTRGWIVYQLATIEVEVQKLTQIRPTPLWNGTFGNSWWYYSKHCHPKLSICQKKGLEVYKAQKLTNNVCQTFYNLETLYNKHNYITNHIWNFDDIGIKICRQNNAKLLPRWKLQQVYNTIPRSR